MDLTIVSPCFNESENLQELVERTEKAVKRFSPNLKFEHILIDNASTDETIHTLVRIKREFDHVRVLKNSQNVGVFSSIQRAMRSSKGKWLVPFLASDMQDPPEVITEFLDVQSRTNCDAVFGIRKKRSESTFLSTLRKIFYLILRKFISGKKYVSGTSEFCLIKRDLAFGVIEYEDPNPFLRIYLSKLTEKVEYVKFTMVERRKGKSSANIFSLVDDALNAFSIIMPSVFSRLFVIVIPITFLLFFSLVVSFIFTITNHFSYLLVFSLLLALLFTILLMVQLLMGHYIFILHGQIRKGPSVQTEEL